MAAMNDQVNVRLESMVQEINAIAKNVALINDKIDSARGAAGSTAE